MRAQEIQRLLTIYCPDPPLFLTHHSPYTLLVAVVLSAHCTDARVNRVTPFLFAYASTPAQMAALPLEKIEELIRSCGLSRTKARYLQELSKKLLILHGGEVPASLEALEELPGVGHKTASVVCSQAFGMATFPVDTHVYRLARRFGLSTSTTLAGVERDLKKCFLKETWGKVHRQLIHYGRIYCPARGHQKENCPICSFLKDYQIV